MLQTETPAQIQSAIATILRRDLQLIPFQQLAPEIQRTNLDSARSLLFHQEALNADKRAIVSYLEVLASNGSDGVRAIAHAILLRWSDAPL